MIDNWDPIPGPLGWVSVFAYWAAAVLSFRIPLQLVRLPQRQLRLWTAIGIVMLLLSINRIFDLQDLVTSLLRSIAEADGWYGRRQGAQYQLVVALLGAGAVVLAIVVLVGQMLSRGLALAFAGVAIILGLYLVKGISLHAADAFFGRNLFGITINSLIENSAILLVCAGAWWTLRTASLTPSSRNLPPRRPGNLGRKGV